MKVYITAPRKLKDGTLVWYARWRVSGRDSKSPAERFTNLALAEKFQKDVQLHGGYPPDYWPGIGYSTPAEMAKYRAAAAAVTEPPAEEGAPQDVRFGTVARSYIDTRSGILKRTKFDYHRDLANHMIGFFGEDTDVRDPKAITPKMVATWVNQLFDGVADPENPEKWIKRPLKPKTIANLHGLLYAILQSTVECEPPLRGYNPCSKTQLPRLDDGDGEDDEMVFLTAGEFAFVYSLAPDEIKDMLAVAIGTGMRFGEFTALQVRDLSLTGDTPSLRVSRAWKRTEDYRFVLGPPKSKAGRRTIPLNRSLVKVLAMLVTGKDRKDYVFTNREGGPWRHANFFNRYWQPLIYRAVRCEKHRIQDRAGGLRMNHLTKQWITPCGCAGRLEKVPRVHDIRHSAAALQIAANVPLMAVQRRFGHESYNTTEKVYGHLVPELDRRQTDAVEEALSAVYGHASDWPVPFLDEDVPDASEEPEAGDSDGDGMAA